MPEEPWVIAEGTARPGRTCCRCARTYSPTELQGHDRFGWQPLHDGWRCPECSRAYLLRVERLARKLIAEHEQDRWLRADEHDEAAECLFCDVIRTATMLVLNRPKPSGRRPS